jgi:hypothetical protein
LAVAFHSASTIFRRNKLTYAPCSGIASNLIQEKSSSSGQQAAKRFSADTNIPRWAGETTPDGGRMPAAGGCFFAKMGVAVWLRITTKFDRVPNGHPNGDEP